MARTKRVTENDDFVAMLQRMHRTLERRAIDDPAILAQMILLAETLSQSVNVVIATSASRYSMNPMASPSAGEIAKLLGMSKQGVSDRRKTGDRVIMDRALGGETAPVRERLARGRAQKHADAALAAWMDRRETTV